MEFCYFVILWGRILRWEVSKCFGRRWVAASSDSREEKHRVGKFGKKLGKYGGKEGKSNLIELSQFRTFLCLQKELGINMCLDLSQKYKMGRKNCITVVRRICFFLWQGYRMYYRSSHQFMSYYSTADGLFFQDHLLWKTIFNNNSSKKWCNSSNNISG